MIVEKIESNLKYPRRDAQYYREEIKRILYCLTYKEKFNIISNESRNLSDEEHSNNYFEYKIDNYDKEWFWHDSFLDMISLSKCGSLIYNVSSLNTTSFLYSNITMNTYRIGF